MICKIPRLRLLAGKYVLLIAASVPPAFEYLDYLVNAAQFQIVEDDVFGTGKVPEYGIFFAECEWSQKVDTAA